MAHRAEIIGQSGYGLNIKVYDDETGQEISAAEQPAEWLAATREAKLFGDEESRNFVGFMIQNGRRLDDLYGPRHETDRA